MNKPILTVLFVTNRGLHCMPGENFSIYTLLSDCLRVQTMQEFDLIVVDERNEVPRHELKWLGDRVRYFRPRDTPWRRIGAFAPNSARNTGLIHARGPVIIGLDDCFSMKSQHYLARIAALALEGVHTASMLSQSDSSVAYPPQPPGPLPVGQHIGGICSYPLAAAVEINGWDERFDGGSGGDIDFTERLRLHGVKMVRDSSVSVVGHNHAGRHSSHPRCWRLAWDIAQHRRGASLRGNDPWTTEEMDRWITCGRELAPRVCTISGGACDYNDSESVSTKAIRTEHENHPWFDLAAERARNY